VLPFVVVAAVGDNQRLEGTMMKIRIGVDIACRSPHHAACADETGAILWSGHRFRTDVAELEGLWARLPGDVGEVMVIDEHGRRLGHREFPARANGYAALLTWIRAHGDVVAIGVESTGSFGASLTRFLTDVGEVVVEVNKPNRQARHMDGKSDRLDAEQIARSVLAQTGTATPKSKSGPIEAIRTLPWPERAPSGPARRPSTTSSAP
jgi:Transposase